MFGARWPVCGCFSRMSRIMIVICGTVERMILGRVTTTCHTVYHVHHVRKQWWTICQKIAQDTPPHTHIYTHSKVESKKKEK